MASLRVSLFIRSIGLILFFAVLWPLGLLVALGSPIGLGATPALIIFLSLTFSQRIASLIDQIQQSDVLLTLFERLAELLDAPVLPQQQQAQQTDISDPADFYESLLTPAPIDIPSPQSITLDNISYRYGESSTLFDNISLNLHSGARIAVIGRSGVGKTSLARLLSGVLQPLSGTILLSTETPNNRSAFTRKHLLVIESNVPELPMMIKDFLNPFDLYIEAQIIQAFATLGTSLEIFPDGLTTGLDHLSLGQRQVINMVRAILSQPRLMVLDEATSGLDSDHERQLLKLLWQAAPDRAYLAILHRPDNLDLFDTVYRLEDGRLEHLPEPVLQQ